MSLPRCARRFRITPPPGFHPGAMAVALACAAPAGSHALGLGAIRGEPVIGETMELTVPLTGSIDRGFDHDCVSLRRPAEAIEAEYFPRDLISRLDTRNGSRVLVLTSRSALRQPLVEFRVQISCGYNLYRDYLLMASPRSVAVPATPAERPAAAVAPPAPAATGQDLRLRNPITLARLARLYGRSRADQERFMDWVVEANPELFAGAEDVRRHRLERGAQLQIPADARRLPPPPPPPRAAQPSAPPAPAAVPATAAAEPPPAPAPKAPARGDRLVVGTDATGARDLKETLALVDRLTGMLEQQVAVQTAAEERIRSLEATVADLTKQVAQADASARQREEAWLTEQREMRRILAERSSQGWVNLLVAILIGGAVGAGLLQLARRLGARQQAEPVFPAGGTVAPEPPEPPAAVPVATAPPPRPRPGADPAPAVVLPPPPPVAPAVAPAAPAAALTAPAPVPSPWPADADDQWPDKTWVNPPERTWVNPPDKTQQLEPEQETGPLAASLDFPIDFDAPEAVPESMPENPGDAALELANIMMSMGLAESAAQTLVDHIRQNPQESLPQWLKLLDLYRTSGKQDSFEASAEEMRHHFNIETATWARPAGSNRASLEAYSHLRAELVRRWGRPDCGRFLSELLTDNRNGTRTGFPRTVIEEILLLIAMGHDSR